MLADWEKVHASKILCHFKQVGGQAWIDGWQAENKPISKQTDIREDPERNENDSTLKYCQTPHDTPVSSGIMSETVFGSANQWNRKKSKITWPRFGVRRGRI